MPLEVEHAPLNLNTRQKDALVFFLRASPLSLEAYSLCDLLAGGSGLGRHPSGAERIIGRLVEIGYLTRADSSDRRWVITELGRSEARRIMEVRRKAGRALVLIDRPPPWALPR